MRTRDGSVLGDMIAGAIGGAIATWAMGEVTTYLYDHEAKPAREAEDRARGGDTAYGAAAQKVARLAGTTLTNADRQRYGTVIHWGMGVGAAALYGALRDRVPGSPLARGLLFGTAVWLLMDEGAVYALGLTPGPTHFPWQTHARGLAGHLVFGAVTDAALAVLPA